VDETRFNVLISSAGRRVVLARAFRHALHDLGLAGEVMATDASRLSSAFHAADRAFLVPPVSSPDFVPEMLRLCRDEGIRLVVPTIDPELAPYAEHRDAFAQIGTTVGISLPEVIRIAEDKGRTHRWLMGHGFPTVEQASPEEIMAQDERWSFPLMVKPRAGSAAIGVTVVRDRMHLEVATRGGDFVVQTIAGGAEYSVDLLADRRGRCRCAVPRRRIEVRAGEVSKGMTARCGPVEECAAQLIQALPGAYGVLTAQIFFDEDSGDLRVIEINPRFGGGYPLAWNAGANYPRWMIEELLGLPSTSSRGSWREQLVMLRYDDAVFIDSKAAGL
jgi:carbamoyl-phosphate synthase large subunit